MIYTLRDARAKGFYLLLNDKCELQWYQLYKGELVHYMLNSKNLEADIPPWFHQDETLNQLDELKEKITTRLGRKLTESEEEMD